MDSNYCSGEPEYMEHYSPTWTALGLNLLFGGEKLSYCLSCSSSIVMLVRQYMVSLVARLLSPYSTRTCTVLNEDLQV